MTPEKPKRRFWVGHSLEPRPKIPREDPPEREAHNEHLRRELKKRYFEPPTLRALTLQASHPSGAHFFWFFAPTLWTPRQNWHKVWFRRPPSLPKKTGHRRPKKKKKQQKQGHRRPKRKEKKKEPRQKNKKKKRKNEKKEKEKKSSMSTSGGKVTKFWEEVQIGWCRQPEKGGAHKCEPLKGYPSRFPNGDP